jgi:hypothetical protein
MQGNLRKLFETVLKTKYYRVLAADIKAKHGLGALLTTLFEGELIDESIKPRLFDPCSVGCPLVHWCTALSIMAKKQKRRLCLHFLYC